MTRKLLKEYISKREEINELKAKMWDVSDGDSEWRKKIGQRYRNRIRILEKECEEAENFIEDIPDSQTRRIFRMIFLEGLSQQSVSEAIHIDRSRVSRKITDYMQVAHKAQKAQV